MPASNAHSPADRARTHPVSEDARIIVLDRPGCHLCEEASQIAHRVASELGEVVEHRSIEADDALKRRWAIEIPVVLVDGEVVAVHRLAEKDLRAALKRRRRDRAGTSRKRLFGVF